MSFSRCVSYFTSLSPGACPRVSLLNRSSRSIATRSPSLSEAMDSGWKRRGTPRHVRWIVLGGGEAKLLLAQVPVVVLVVLLPLFVRVLVMPAGPVYPKLERLTCGHEPPLK